MPTNNITSPTPPTNPLDPLSSSTNFFFNTTLANNTAAVAGGAIYLDTTSSAVPGFTDNCMVSNNFASGFGGGLFIAEYSREQTFMNLTVFDYKYFFFFFFLFFFAVNLICKIKFRTFWRWKCGYWIYQRCCHRY